MDKGKYEIHDAAGQFYLQPVSGDAGVCLADSRVGRLLIVLTELDECVAGLEYLAKPELKELISSAITGCGFTNPDEARYAIATILQAIEASHSTAHA